MNGLLCARYSEISKRNVRASPAPYQGLHVHSAWPWLPAVGNSEQGNGASLSNICQFRRLWDTDTSNIHRGAREEIQADCCRGSHGVTPSTFQNEMPLAGGIPLRETMCHIHSQFNYLAVYFVRQSWGELLLNLSMSGWHQKAFCLFCNFLFYMVMIEKRCHWCFNFIICL